MNISEINKALEAVTIAEITPARVERVYSGRQGCMCGCLGTYSANPRQVTRVLNLLKKDPRTVVQSGYILHIDDKLIGDRERNYVIYLKRPGKKWEDA